MSKFNLTSNSNRSSMEPENNATSLTMALKVRKENEQKMQEQLYGNIFLLTLTHPTTNEDFKTHFTRDMFAKNNKSAFHHMVYYLLSVLDPQLTKTKLVTWPILDSRSEVQFRKELLTYLNELNVLYEGANIPSVMASHLISPGGYKFLKFMLKLSQLVVFEHLRRDENLHIDLLRNSGTANKLVKMKTDILNRNTLDVKAAHEKYLVDASNEAGSILRERNEVQKSLKEVKKILLQEDEVVFSIDSIDLEITNIKTKIEKVKEILRMCVEIKEVSYMFSDDDIVISNENCNVNGISKPLDLLSLFDDLRKFLEVMRLKIPNITNFYLTNNIEKYKNFNKKLELLNDQFVHVFADLEKLKYQGSLENCSNLRSV